jgi:hypothetical protein
MTSSISKLTPHLDTVLHSYYADWLEVTRTTAKADRRRVEESIRKIYSWSELAPPVVIWCQSPLQLAVLPTFVALCSRLSEYERAVVRERLEARKKRFTVDVRNWITLWNTVSTNIDKITIDGQLGGHVSSLSRRFLGEMAGQLGHESDSHIAGEAKKQLDSMLRSRLQPDFEASKVRIGMSVPLWDFLNGEMWQFIAAVTEARAAGSGSVGWFKKIIGSPIEDKEFKVEWFLQELHHHLGVAASNWWGPWDMYWLLLFDFARQNIQSVKYSEPNDSQATAWLTLTRHAAAYEFRTSVCFVCEHPTHLSLDNQANAHRENGPAMEFSDGWNVYAWHGRRVPSEIIEYPERITVRQIEKERNIEVRRIMIQRYGERKFFVDSGALEIHKDSFGTLYRKEMEGDEPLVMVKVMNSTPEWDGSHKGYFIRVPPEITTAKAAVAWSFQLASNEYDPNIET